MKQRWKNWAPHVVAWVAALTTVLGVWVVTHDRVQNQRQDTERSVRRELSNLSRLSEEHASRTLHAADQALQLIRVLYLRDGPSLDLGALARQGAIDMDIFHLVGIIDAQGIYRLSNLPNTPQVNLADREHFKVHVDRTTDELFVSKPVLGRVSKKWTIQLTRRIAKPDGTFDGVAMVSLDADYFANFYASLDLGAQGAAALVGRDGVVRVRRSKDSSAIGVVLTQPRGLVLLEQGKLKGFLKMSPRLTIFFVCTIFVRSPPTPCM